MKWIQFWNWFFFKMIDYCRHIFYCDNQHRFTSKWTQLLNKLMVKNMHSCCHLQCCCKLYTFTLKWIQLLKDLVLKIIHFYDDLQCSQTSAYIDIKINSIVEYSHFKNDSFLIWSSILLHFAWIHLPSEFNYWMKS
jgi:hypothetical protein